MDRILKILDKEGLKNTFKLILDYIRNRFNILSKDLENEGIYIDDKDTDFSIKSKYEDRSSVYIFFY